MQAIIFFTLAISAMVFVIYLGARSTVRGMKAKSERISEEEELKNLPENNTGMIYELEKLGLNMNSEVKSISSNVFTGLTFVITGTLHNLTRKDTEELIKTNGGKVTNSVTSKTSYLITGDSPGSKLTKAQEIGTTVLTESEFLALMPWLS